MLVTSGLNDCCWSLILRVDIFSIISINSVVFVCCKLHFCHDFALTVLPVLILLRYFSYQLLNKECLNAVFKLSFSCFQLTSDCFFGENHVSL